jgi:hypothetical protein
MAWARATASSMASFVPDPIVKCAVWAASPIEHRRSRCHDSQRTVTKLVHSDRFDRSRWPRSSSANSASQNAMLSSSVASRSPAASHVASGHSTMNVLVGVERVAVHLEQPVLGLPEDERERGNTRSVPNHTYRVRCTSSVGR